MANICNSVALRTKDHQETQISRDPRDGFQSSKLSLFFAMLHIMGIDSQSVCNTNKTKAELQSPSSFRAKVSKLDLQGKKAEMTTFFKI